MNKKTNEKEENLKKSNTEGKTSNIKVTIIKVAIAIIMLILVAYLLITFSKKEEEPELKPAPNTTIDYNLLNVERSDGNIVMEDDTNAEVKDGVKRNTSTKVTEQKTYNDMIVKNARIEASGGNSQFIAVVENPYDKPIESEEVEVVFINEDGSEIARIETTFPELEPNGTSELGASTDIDITTAYDFYIALKK